MPGIDGRGRGSEENRGGTENVELKSALGKDHRDALGKAMFLALRTFTVT